MKIYVKVWTSDLKEFESFTFQSSLKQKAELVRRFVADLEEKFPGNSLRVIPIGQNRYNVIPEVLASA